MSIYENNEYKPAIRTLMKERQKQFGSRFTFEKMAAACGIQKTYLSKVLNSSAQLNPDQLFSACEYLKLDSRDTEFLVILREAEIALHPKRAKILKAKVAKIRSDNLKTESAIEVVQDNFIEGNKWDYYTDVDLQLVHMFMTVSDYAKNPILICKQIGISELRLQAILLKLQSWQLLRYQEGAYCAEDPKLHLPEDSPMFLTFGILNRIKTIEKLRITKIDRADDYFFSVMFSASTKLQSKFKRKILELLKELQTEVVDSKSEQVYQLNIDFFKWSWVTR